MPTAGCRGTRMRWRFTSNQAGCRIRIQNCVKKSSRCSAIFISGALALAAGAGCGPRHQSPPGTGLVRGEEACARLQTFFSRTVPRPLEMHGRATFDVEDYRVRGRFTLKSFANGDAVLEFGGATLLGGHREDVVVSLSGDTLRVLDRERGRYWEGEDAERMLAEGSDTAGDWLLALRRILASGCPGVESLQAAEDGIAGSGPDGPFALRAPDGPLEDATWPNPAPEDTFRDRLEVRYRWSNGR